MASKSEVLLMALAIKRNLIAKDQVQACMNMQKDLSVQGVTKRLEDIVIEQGYLTHAQIDEMRAPPVPPAPQEISIDVARQIPIYEMHDVLGVGGMASVFYATHRETGQKRAVKVLFKEHTNNAQFVDRFLREGKLLKAFDSRNIARGHEYGKAGDDLYFMGMELIEGLSLQEILDKTGPFPEQRAIYCITEAAKALAYMQAKGVVHRDIKPDNIMWNRDGRVMLVDLGFAKSIAKAGEESFEDETCGTVQYISPEQARGKADVDIRADIYSLGATLYHLVLGELPFSGKDSMEVMSKQVLENLNAVTLKSGKISMHMHYFIEKMMAKDRDIRYQSAQEIVSDVTTVLTGAPGLKFDPDDVDVISKLLNDAAEKHAATSSVRLPNRLPHRRVSDRVAGSRISSRRNTAVMTRPGTNSNVARPPMARPGPMMPAAQMPPAPPPVVAPLVQAPPPMPPPVRPCIQPAPAPIAPAPPPIAPVFAQPVPLPPQPYAPVPVPLQQPMQPVRPAPAPYGAPRVSPPPLQAVPLAPGQPAPAPVHGAPVRPVRPRRKRRM